MKFIHISDVHLGAMPDRDKKWGNDREREIEEGFCDIVETCQNSDIDLLLIAGDLFDAPPTKKQLKFVDMQLVKMSKTRTVIITGNSDYADEDSEWNDYKFNSKTIVFPRDKSVSVFLDDLNVNITGYSYGKPEYTERILERLKPGRTDAYNILLGHGGDRTHMPFSKDKLARNGFDYVALGHIHKPSHILKNKMAFSGSLEPLSYREVGKRGYILGEVNDGETKITMVTSNKRSYINMTLELDPTYSNAEISNVVEDNISNVGKQNIYRILLKGKVASDVEINLSELIRRYNISEIIDKTEAEYGIEELFIANENNLIGRFISRLKPEEKEQNVIDVFDENDTLENENIRKKALRYGVDALLEVGE